MVLLELALLEMCMKKAAVFFAGTCLMALVFFCACGQGNVPKSNQAQTQSSTSAQGTSRSSSSSSVSEVPTYSLDQVKNYGSIGGHRIFILRGEKCLPLTYDAYEDCSHPDGSNIKNATACVLYKDEDSESTAMPVLDLSAGDKLITRDEWQKGKMFAYPIVGTGYVENTTRDTRIHDYSEVNGQEVGESDEKVVEALRALGVHASEGLHTFTSDAPISFTIGGYGGVDFIEKTVNVDKPYSLAYKEERVRGYVSSSDPSEFGAATLRQERTKEGYFLIDTSELTSGKYMILNRINESNPGYSIFEVK